MNSDVKQPTVWVGRGVCRNGQVGLRVWLFCASRRRCYRVTCGPASFHCSVVPESRTLRRLSLLASISPPAICPRFRSHGSRLTSHARTSIACARSRSDGPSENPSAVRFNWCHPALATIFRPALVPLRSGSSVWQRCSRSAVWGAVPPELASVGL